MTGNVAEILSDKAGNTAYRGEAMKVRAALATVLLGLVLAGCTSEAATPVPAPVTTTTSTTAAAKVIRTLTLSAESPSLPTRLSFVNYTCGDYSVSACDEQIPVDTWTKTVQLPVGMRATLTVTGGIANNSCSIRAQDGTVLVEERYTGHCEVEVT